MANIPEEVRLCVEMLIHSASKHGFVFQGMLERLPGDKPDASAEPDIMIIRNTKDPKEKVAECFRMYADMIDEIPTANITRVEVPRPA